MLGPVEVVAEIDSTNQALLDRARAGGPAGLVLVADHQTAGRGRLGRRWESSPGAALLVSVLLRPSLPAASAHLVMAAAGVAAVDVCRELGAEVGLKWPNDVVAGEAKLAGLLAESIVSGDRLDAVVVGMGMNLRAGSAPDGAAALDTLVGRTVDRDDVLDRWLTHLESRYSQDPGTLAEAHRARCSTLGRRVRVDLADRTVFGLAEDVTVEGHLVVRADDGGQVDVAAGDVVHLRPATG